jgi:hypothetical protein
LSQNMFAIHHISKTKTKTHPFNALIIENLSVASSRKVKRQSWTTSNRDSLSNISISRDETATRSPMSYSKPFMILLSPTWPSKDGSANAKMAIFHVVTMLGLFDSW